MASNRYVILRHTGAPGPDHLDFMLESGDTLKTWTIHSTDFTVEQTITQNSDHRLQYLDYEGPISGERGEVKRVAAGTYEVGAWSPDKILLTLSREQTVILKLVSGRHWTIGPAT